MKGNERCRLGTQFKRGSTIYVYDEKGRQIFTQFAGSRSNDGLQGYTGGTVNIRRGSTIYTYNEKGHQISMTYARWAPKLLLALLRLDTLGIVKLVDYPPAKRRGNDSKTKNDARHQYLRT